MKNFFLACGLLMSMTFRGIFAQTIDVNAQSEPINHYWSKGVCAGRVNEGLRVGWLEQLEMVHRECGFQYVRMHAVFNDDMFVYFEKPDGKVVYNWQYIDEVYDRMLALGVKPFVELSFFPKDMAAPNTKTQMWYKNNVSFDRKKLGNWHDLVKAFTQHVVDRYGIDEVLKWYFEVWNEPNLTGLGGFFHGTKSEYFLLYRESAKAIKSVDNRLKVGGPATSNFIPDARHDGEILDHSKSRYYPQDVINTKEWKGVWIKDFLRYCEKESLPVDFISTHPYPTDYALDPETGRSFNAIRYIHSLKDDINWLHNQIKNSKYPNAEIHLTEWSTSPNSRDAMHDELPPAAFIVKSCLDCLGMANSLMYWTFTDIFEEKGGAEEIFHGGFGMINFQGIVKPSFHAYRMLHQLGDEKIYYQDPLFVSRSSQDGKISAIAFNYPKEFESHVPGAKDIPDFYKASAKQLNLTLKGLMPNAVFQLDLLDADHGNVIAAYNAMGRPHSPNKAQTEWLRQQGQSTLKWMMRADEHGELTINRELAPWACLLIKEM